ncbi:MAG: arylsulfotransferase family protein [Pseudomonadota bacterium]
MKLPIFSSGLYLFGVATFSWGFAAGGNHIFPGPMLNLIKDEVSDFTKGSSFENLSLSQMLQNDLGGTPYRLIRDHAPAFPNQFSEMPVPGLKDRRQNPRTFIDEDRSDFFRMVVGAFDFEEAFWGAVLISPAGDVVHTWHLKGDSEALTQRRDTLKIGYGVAVFPDGSIVINKQEDGGGLSLRTLCSELAWSKPGVFHHSAEPTERGDAFWTLGGYQSDIYPELVLIDAATGDTLRQIDMAEVDRANAHISILHMTRHEEKIGEVVFGHVTHPNDVEPLPSAIADAFPMFEAGDLLINYRNINLMFVLDPETLQIKWRNFGALDAGHDPDWQPDGTIVAYDNSARAADRAIPLYSRIVSIDPITGQSKAIVEGKAYDFFSKYNGRQQVTPNGTVLITISTQGRVLEVDPRTGDVIFDFVNSYDWKEGKTLHLSDAFAIDAQTAGAWLKNDCSKKGIY